MKPIYIDSYIPDLDGAIFKHLTDELEWLNVTPARREFFMAFKPLSYAYGSGSNIRDYDSAEFSKPVQQMMDRLNQEYNCQYNVCFLNRYDNAKNQLGWHADDSPEMNMSHDICVISFGAAREIWWKHKEFKGEIPKENRQLLGSGSLFVMPAGFQRNNLHKIPRWDRECSTRVSLTFRNYVEVG